MSVSIKKLRDDIDVTRRELKNIRQELQKQKVNLNTEVGRIKSNLPATNKEIMHVNEKESMQSVIPIGYISSCFKFKNGIPRQPSLCPSAKGTLKIEKCLFTNPEHSLLGLHEFSHIWILFLFHENGHSAVKAKVHPPRLNGASVGVFSTRSPHRPSPIGLSLTKIDKIEGDTLFISGIDLLDGTPVLDIKPYIPMYDNPIIFSEVESSEITEESNFYNEQSKNHTNNEPKEKTNGKKEVNCSPAEFKVPSFLRESFHTLDVTFTNRALGDLKNFHSISSHEGLCEMCLNTEYQPSNLKQTIVEILQNDPRSIYRKEKCTDKLYYFYINNFHITCWFDDSLAEVLRIKSSVESR